MAAKVAVQANGDFHSPKVEDGTLPSVLERYNEERNKRLRDDGLQQFIDLNNNTKYEHFARDPYATADPHAPLQNGDSCKILISGAGFGGIQMAVKLLQAGFNARDLVVVDPAGGFGGTWYWNRYPGLMCDVESYIYLPFLEETGYVPKRKYASGHEIRSYCELLVDHYGLRERGMFQTSVDRMAWDGDAREWVVNLQRRPKGKPEETLTVKAEFTFLAPGVLNNPQLAGVPGLDLFDRHCFHTSRWDYEYTGGSPAEPTLSGLDGKRVGIIGTGATAVQCVPHIAKYAKQLYVFQRTPSAIDTRGNRDTDLNNWKQIAATSGWWSRRAQNWHDHTTDSAAPDEPDLVDDQWTKMKAYRALLGPADEEVTMENVGQYVQSMYARDLPRTTRVRSRVDEVVYDSQTAAKLKAWYPTWCKRPAFHDEYLQSFNQPNVELVDTNGKGVERLTRTGVVVDGTEYPVDVLIFSTGFRSPTLGSAAEKANIEVVGRNGQSMNGPQAAGLTSLHGVISRNFPNMFKLSALQAGVSPNWVFTSHMITSHVAHTIATASDKGRQKVVVEPSQQAEDDWASLIMSKAMTFAAAAGCTPSYFNKQGESDKPQSVDEQMKAARLAPFGGGFNEYVDILRQWREEGSMKGLEISSVKT